MQFNYKILLLIGFFLSATTNAQTSIFSYGSSWKYLDNGTNPGTSWTTPAFIDASWPSGNAQLGYGDGDEATIISYGSNAASKYISSYFRKTINISNPSLYNGFSATVKRDDGIVIYINGNEVYRNNMPSGVITNTTLASGAASDDGNTAQSFTIPLSFFIAGDNCLAVEIHQSSISSSDLSFDMNVTASNVPVNNSIIAFGSNWKYLDNGSNAGTSWRSITYNDVAWKNGNAQLGYGDGDETTVVGYGTSSTAKYITTYFRKSFSVSDVSGITGYSLNLKRDDGAVVYINGTEVFRSNMPTGTIGYRTRATAAAADDGNTAQTTSLGIGQLLPGTNVMAVEIHQNVASSADISFDLELKSTATTTSATLTRGPYLNLATQSSIIIRWKTDIASNSKVNIGTTAENLTQSTTDNTITTDHIVTLTGLTANTKYFYSIGSATQTLQGNAENYFKTLPPDGSIQKVRILAMGDMGNNSTTQRNVRDAYRNFNGSNHTDIWMLMGDNAYDYGTDGEYQTGFFNIYDGSISKNHVLWPSPGNHEYASSSARQADHNIDYYKIFSLPKLGEAGGLPSNTEAFYSFNYANIHFVALDSYGWETGNTRLYDTLGPQAVWMKQDLAANSKAWTIVFFHHPPYTKGSHNSDTENELINIRSKVIRILERYKVDLVLCGHSHSYERSFPLNGHYGTESTFNSTAHALSNSSGKYDGSSNSCPYIKNNNDTRNGIIYAVVGSAGQLEGSSSGYPHNAMYYSNVSVGGSLFFEIENNRLDAKWINANGTVQDNFTMFKNVNKSTALTITSGNTITLTASWQGNYIWSTGATTQSISISPTTNTSITVRDSNNCITDVFTITVSANLATTLK